MVGIDNNPRFLSTSQRVDLITGEEDLGLASTRGTARFWKPLLDHVSVGHAKASLLTAYLQHSFRRHLRHRPRTTQLRPADVSYLVILSTLSSLGCSAPAVVLHLLLGRAVFIL